MELKTRLPKIKVNNALQYAIEPDDLEAPIIGHEIRQPRKRHTVYKIYVHYSDKQGWFVYRRYREFYKLRDDLKKLFPVKEFTLPPKRYFGDNFEPRFLNSRRQGLQGFIYMITRQRDVQKSAPVGEFLALTNPPSIADDIEQCRAVIEQMEETVAKLKAEESEHNTSIASSNSQIVELHEQKQAVLAALRHDRKENGRKHYPGDDLSLMFEYRALPEVCRVDVSSFLVRKPAAYLARKFEDKTHKEEARAPRDHGSARTRALTPPGTQRKERQKLDATRKHSGTQSPKFSHKGHSSSSESVVPSNGKEFQSFFDLKQRRKSMPAAVEFHRVNHLLKALNQPKPDQTPRPTSLAVPDTQRPRSMSATRTQLKEYNSFASHAATNRVTRQTSLERPKGDVGWSSLRDLRKLKGKS